MKQKHFFGNAKWMEARDCAKKQFSILRGHFTADRESKVSLNVLGLGFFKCYINGILINPDTFLPLSSDYEASCDPPNENLSGHRVYVPQFDVSRFINDGDNVIAIHFGGGWYTAPRRSFGTPKAIYRITVSKGGETVDFCSDERCKIGESFIYNYQFVSEEAHCYLSFPDCFGTKFDDDEWENAVPATPLRTEYCLTDCPADALIDTISPQKIGNGVQGSIYDCGKNISGYPVLDIFAETGETVTVLFSEELCEDGKLDPTHAHKQQFLVVSDGNARTVQPQFTWFGFRYFEVIGNAIPRSVSFVHANVPVTSSFACDNVTLNWIYRTFLHTMLCNMHTGHPSDCPHLERRGYTGDGQLTCHAALSTLGGKSFYEKWLQDIADCQDVLSGHIQYTAPYIRSGGGPGGWGCAIVEVPYQLYLHYGETQILKKYYPNMRRYIDYLEAHSDFGLVTSDKEGAWCLGDWCGPVILYPEKDITVHDQQVMLPAPMVNTYFMVKSLDRLAEIARIIGKAEDIEEYRQKAELRKKAIQAAYFNTFDGNFLMNVQGANAYAVDLGLGNSTTYPNLTQYYQKLGHYDTGIFATDILTRILFERGDAELAVDLLTNNGEQGFAHWQKNGATTFHEYWDSNRSRSHNHPMFGAPVAYLFEYLLGIHQAPKTAGYTSLIIEPLAISKFQWMKGDMETPSGTVAVEYQRHGDSVDFKIQIPSRVQAILRYQKKDYPLRNGENLFYAL